MVVTGRARLGHLRDGLLAKREVGVGKGDHRLVQLRVVHHFVDLHRQGRAVGVQCQIQCRKGRRARSIARHTTGHITGHTAAAAGRRRGADQ